MQVNQKDQIFSWIGFELERDFLRKTAENLRNYSEKCVHDTTFFTNCVSRDSNLSEQDKIPGNSLFLIKELTKELVQRHNFNWNFVYREWSTILNPNEFQKNLTKNLVVGDFIKSIE